MLRLRRVLVRRFRSATPETELSFGPDFVFILGKNGTGKSTLLELLTLLISCELAPFRNEEQPVDLEWDLEGALQGPSGPCLFRLRLHLRVKPGEPDKPEETQGGGVQGSMVRPRSAPEWTLRGEASLVEETPRTATDAADTHRDPSLVTAPSQETLSSLDFHYRWDGPPAFGFSHESAENGPTGPPPSPFDAMFIFRLSIYLFDRVVAGGVDFSGRFIELRQAFMQLTGPLREPLLRFDEGLAAFQAIVGGAEPLTTVAEVTGFQPGYVSHFTPVEVALETIRPRDDAGKPSEEGAALPTGDQVPTVLRKAMAGLLGAEALVVHPRLYAQDGKGRTTWRGFDLVVRWPGAVRHRHDQLSFGQKRLIAFLWYAEVYDRVPLVCDELTNGMHASWVRGVVDWLEGRQAFFALQNPLLLDQCGPGTEAEIPGRFVFCEVGETEEARSWSWRNPTPEEASRLRKAWDTGFQQLSEVLESEGLW